MKLNSRAEYVLKEIANRYVWWDSYEEHPTKNIAQIINKGTIDDINALINAVGATNIDLELEKINVDWISQQRWDFYHKKIRGKDIVPPLPKNE